MQIMKKHIFAGLSVLLVLVFVALGVSGSRADIPPLPEQPEWFRAPTDGKHRGQRAELMDGEEVATFFQERFRDRDLDLGLRSGGMGHPSALTAPMPRVVMPQQAGREQEHDRAGGIFSFSGEPRERTGWGWLADDVQQMRGPGSATDAGRSAPMELPRRFDATDDGFRTRRWLED